MMNEREQNIQSKIVGSNIGSLWDLLGQYSRGTPRLIMYLFDQKGPVKVGDLALAFSVSTARVSSMIRRLEFDRIVHRAKRRIDYRSTYIELTPKGEEKAKELFARSQAIIHELIERVGIETVERFLDDAETLHNAAKELFREESKCSA